MTLIMKKFSATTRIVFFFHLFYKLVQVPYYLTAEQILSEMKKLIVLTDFSKELDNYNKVFWNDTPVYEAKMKTVRNGDGGQVRGVIQRYLICVYTWKVSGYNFPQF